MAEEKQQQQQPEASKSEKKKPSGGQTIIIKKISAAHHGHHGGAWKVAYADFVTAMMAFFLLLWLLNSVPVEKLSGIAQYFEPTVGLAGQKGIGFEGGKSQNKEGSQTYDRQAGIEYGVVQKGQIIANPERGVDIKTEEIENERFAMVEGELKKTIMADKELVQFQDSIIFDITPEGMQIKITDQDKFPMFKENSPELEVYAKNIISKIVNLIKYSPNYIAISGHTDSDQTSMPKDYTNWELSSDRANSTRRFIVEQGIPADQISRIVGKADTEPLDPANPNSSRNRRVTITLLRNSIAPFNKVALPKNFNATNSPAN